MTLEYQVPKLAESTSPVMHYEVYRSGRDSSLITVPCWCSIARSHSYLEWVDAGKPRINAPGARASRGRRKVRTATSS